MSPEGAWSGESPQGDRKGPHPAPHRPRPYYEVIITHIFLGSLVERNYRAELVHKRYHAKCLVTSVHRNAPKDMGNDDIIVRAGVVWSGVGTLAVALGDTMCRGESTVVRLR